MVADRRGRGQAWRDYGEVIVAEDLHEMVKIADDIASEHVQVMTADDDLFLNTMTNYGALFWGRAPMSPMATK